MLRIKHLWRVLPLPEKLKLFWERVSFSRITQFYFLFSVLHCIVQVVFQVQAFSINAQATDFLKNIVHQGNATDQGFSVMANDGLYFCDDIPDTSSVKTCQRVWSPSSPVSVESSDMTSNGLSAIPGAVSFVASPMVSSQVSVEAVTSSTLLATPTLTISSVASSSSLPHPTTKVDVAVTTTTTKIVLVPATRSSSASSSAPTQQRNESHAKGGDDQEESEDDDQEHDQDTDEDTEHSLRRRSSVFGTISTVQVNGSTVVNINGLGWENETITLARECLLALNWPLEKLEDTKREDITFIGFQFWVLGMSIVAILNESMPHIIASLLTHILATAWGGFQIAHTAEFRAQFNRLTTDGACKPTNLLMSYWGARANAEIPSLALNAAALLLSAFLSWRLIKLFGWQTFKRVGASRKINRIYKLVLSLSIALQLSLFFIVVTVGLWIDQVKNGHIGRLMVHGKLYMVLMILVSLLLVPWLTMGWISVRRELRVPMIVFLALSAAYLAGWGAMFTSKAFRWTYMQWLFFSLIATASVFLTLVTLILGIICRINFGKGLPHYLNSQEPLPGDFVTVASSKEIQNEDYGEKVSFPSSNAIPTFSVAFGRGNEVPPPSRMNFGRPQLGPRFNNPSAEPFEPQPVGNFFEISPPPTAVTLMRSDSNDHSSQSSTTLRELRLARAPSNGSYRSYSSTSSDGRAPSSHSGASTRSDNSKGPLNGWILE